MKLTVLTENTTSAPEMLAEHGLSLLLEVRGHSILFDMGQSDAFAVNARRLGLDLSAVDTAVLSHGHYDHGGGIRTFLAQNERAPVYVSRAAFGAHYNGMAKYIGLDPSLQYEPRLILADAVQTLGDGLTLYTVNDAPYRHPIRPFGLTVCRGGRFVPEDFCHEQYLLIEENGRRILVSGCSHKGIGNIMAWFRPDVLIGGFHFMKLDPAEEADRAMLDAAAEELLSYPTMYYTGHCTGEAQFAYLKTKMGERLEYLHTGRIVEI
ncbi:MAG: MBL fold metallo-hydrolase [Clostridia bacterium]|nr:MBL fold metallo-hydrolase [Clostridia bacterium]